MSHKQPLAVLRAVIRQHGTQAATAKALGLSQSYLSDLLRGRRAFSVAVLDKLGLEQKTVIVERRSA